MKLAATKIDRRMATREHRGVLHDNPGQATRVYVSGSLRWPSDDMAQCSNPGCAGCDKCNAFKAQFRADVKVTREALESLLPDLGGLRFSRTAGCRCGCSPGFIAKAHRGQDIYITLVALPE